MTGIERRQYEMLVRVRNVGETTRALFESSPVAQQTFLMVGAAIDDLGPTCERWPRRHPPGRTVGRRLP